MQLEWDLRDEYSEIGSTEMGSTGMGGVDLLRDAVGDALAVLPREHLRRLAVITVEDEDPRGKALGIWRLDHRGAGITLYAQPHVRPLLRLPPEIRAFALRLYLGYTLFHEVGHHVTRFLNKRAAPSKKAALVDQKIERWADEYAEKRTKKLVDHWLQPGGLAESPPARQALESALQVLRLDTVVAADTRTQSVGTGTNPSEMAS